MGEHGPAEPEPGVTEAIGIEGIQRDIDSLHRPVLAPVPTNHRRFPPRPHPPLSPPHAPHMLTQGTKRKRQISGNENTHVLTRSTRAVGRFKRRKSSPAGDDSDMDIDHADNGENNVVKKTEEEEKERPQRQNLIWDRDGKKLIYATGNHVCY